MLEDFFFLRPQSGRRDLVGKRLCPEPTAAIFISPPRLGLVISTFGSPAYVELALEVRKRLYPNLPVLVHDDASPQADELQRLCAAYGVEFECNSARLGHEMGDLSSVVGGLHWAKEMGVELLVKMSRRFVPLTNWTGSLTGLAMTRQYGTYGRHCADSGLPLRTECFAMYVGHWASPEILATMTDLMLTNRISVYLEKYVFDCAAKVHALRCLAAREWESRYIRVTPQPVVAEWSFVPPGRKAASREFLWHQSVSGPQAYAEAAKQIGLQIPPAAFEGIFSQAGT